MTSNDTRHTLEDAIIDYGVQRTLDNADREWEDVLDKLNEHEVQCEKEAFDRGFSSAIRGVRF